MSDRRYIAIFGAAVLTASAATFSVYRILSAAAAPRREPVRGVVVATRDVPAGVPVPSEALAVVPWPVRVAPGESFAAADSVAGRVTRAPLTHGDPVLASRLATRGASPGLEGTIDPDRRAMAVRVSEAAGVSGLVRPNSRVDVLLSARGNGTAGEPTARVLMVDVRVLGVGSVRPPESASPDAGPSPATQSIVTLEVTPDQAARLAAADGQGALQVVLRGYGSTDRMPEPVAPLHVGAPAGVPPSPQMTGNGGAPFRSALRSRASHHPGRTAAPDVKVGSDAAARVAARPDSGRAPSATVRVYRGDQMTLQQVDVAEPVAPAMGGSPERPLRTAVVGARASAP